MNTLEFVKLNQTRIRKYEKLTYALGMLLLLTAAYLLIGGLFRILFSQGDAQHQDVNAFGFAPSFSVMIHQLSAVLILGLISLAVGDYLAYVLGPWKQPRFGFGFLPGVLILGAAVSILLAAYSLVWFAIGENARTLGTGAVLPHVVGSLVLGTIPRVTSAVAQVGLAIAVRKLSEIIKEEKETV